VRKSRENGKGFAVRALLRAGSGKMMGRSAHEDLLELLKSLGCDGVVANGWIWGIEMPKK
jgi:hypothetical protein